MNETSKRAPVERDVGQQCGCVPFCETHGRDEIAVDQATGLEFCNECAAEGFTGELCHPWPDSCDMLSSVSNEWERTFMCPEHAEQHRAFCAECKPPNAVLSGCGSAGDQENGTSGPQSA